MKTAQQFPINRNFLKQEKKTCLCAKNISLGKEYSLRDLNLIISFLSKKGVGGDC
jgi:hypothetical protein